MRLSTRFAGPNNLHIIYAYEPLIWLFNHFYRILTMFNQQAKLDCKLADIHDQVMGLVEKSITGEALHYIL